MSIAGIGIEDPGAGRIDGRSSESHHAYLPYLFTLLAYPFQNGFSWDVGALKKQVSLLVACGRRLCCYRSLDARREVGGLFNLHAHGNLGMQA